MRRAFILAAILAVVAVGSVQAKANVPKVNGTYTFNYTDDPANDRLWSLNVQGTDPVKGTWSSVRLGVHLSGPVTCLRVSGPDAWLAGPITSASQEFPSLAVFAWVHDGGTPGRDGDLAFGWYADLPEGLAQMEALCEAMSSDLPGDAGPFAVLEGNVHVH